MRNEGNTPEDVRAQAADWFARLKSVPVSRDTLEQFRAWRKQASHSEAFDEVETFWNASGEVGERPRVLAAIDAAMAGGGPAARRRSIGRTTKLVVGALGVVGAAALVAALTLVNRGDLYLTTVGQQSVVTLEDGSRVALDTDTKLEVRYSKDAREIVLERGQALFTVAHAPARPFTVTAGGTHVVATGTQFEVNRMNASTEVTLVEGRVRVSDAGGRAPFVLNPGQQARLRVARAPDVRPVNVSTATAWTHGRIIFDGVPLEDAVAEVNRYTARPIRLAPGLQADRKLSGTFDTGDIDSFVTAATELLPIRAERASDGTVRLIDASSDGHK